MTSPLQTQSLLPLLLLAVAATLAAEAAATADEQQPAAAITLPDCPSKCGNISIPYPFGLKPGCFLPGFEVTCDNTSDPPRAFLAADNPVPLAPDQSTRPYMAVAKYNYSIIGPDQQERKIIYLPRSPVELMDVSVSQGQARAHGSFSFDCSTNKTYHTARSQGIFLPSGTPFLVSQTSNIFMVIGDRVEGNLQRENSLVDHVRTEAACFEKGWCKTGLPANARGTDVSITPLHNGERGNINCSYAMVVDKSWYNFSWGDVKDGDGFLRRNNVPGVPVVLDFTIRSVLCPGDGQPEPKGYACASANSSCVNGPIYPGHHCKCADGYDGNPYIPDGCQDIDECQRPNQYPCNGKCENRIGGYDCTCPAGTRGNATEGQCHDIFPLPIKVSLGAVGCLFIMAILFFILLLRNEKRKMKEFFKKNGGPTLEKAKIIKIFKKEDLKPILTSSNFIGNGSFGEVYKGLIDNEVVAVKKPIIGSMLHTEQFANEVIIQSQVIHKNIVRLIGCCLEVDIPMLVYEYLSKGSLHDILHKDRNVDLNLDLRLSIAAESADGLAYMHSKANSKILHGDVKPANILLNDNFVPKISDFGISRLIVRDKEHTGSIIGDMTYMDPVYLQTGLLTEKSDVYSFGVVLLELISRKKPTYSDNNSLVRNFLDAHKKGEKGTELFDKKIATTTDLEHLHTLAGIAVECLSLDVDQRPAMTDIAERLVILKRSRKS